MAFRQADGIRYMDVIAVRSVATYKEFSEMRDFNRPVDSEVSSNSFILRCKASLKDAPDCNIMVYTVSSIVYGVKKCLA